MNGKDLIDLYLFALKTLPIWLPGLVAYAWFHVRYWDNKFESDNKSI